MEKKRHPSSPRSRDAPQELPVFVAADGIYLTTEDGRTFLDFASGFESADTSVVRDAVSESLRSAHFHGDTETRFLEELQAILPTGLSHVHPARDGSEATEVALSACMRYTGANTFLAFNGGYHGATLGALAVSQIRQSHELMELSAPKAQFIPFPQADDPSPSAVAGAVRAVTERPADTPALAGIIVEAVQATAGIRLPPQTFLPTLARAARSASIPLIVDEIYTGFGRTGRAFACENSSVDPDLLLLGNGMGSGLPGGAVAGRTEIISTFPATPHRLHPMTATACVAALRYARKNWSRAGAVETWFESFRARFERHPRVRRYRGVGAMYGVEVKSPAELTNQELAEVVRDATVRQGLLCWECGVDATVIGLIPPLSVTKGEVDDACNRVLAALDTL